MHSALRALAVFATMALAGGCGEKTVAVDGGTPAAQDGGNGVRAGLQYSGSLVLVRTPVTEPADSSAPAAPGELFEISAPILPSTEVLYAHQGTSYPSTLAEEQSVAHAAALTFDFLMTSCADEYSIVLLPAGGAPLPPEVIANNYEQVARCSYDRYVAKPYWIPALVDHVDICATELGAGWRLVAEEDTATLSRDERQFLIQGLATPNSTGFFGSFYFSLAVWVRASDGTLKLGSLAPDDAQLAPAPTDTTSHFEGGYGLRCVRRAVIDE
jgi:hypothetical protein